MSADGSTWLHEVCRFAYTASFFPIQRYILPIQNMAFSTTIKGKHNLQGNVQVYNVRIPVLGAAQMAFVPTSFLFPGRRQAFRLGAAKTDARPDLGTEASFPGVKMSGGQKWYLESPWPLEKWVNVLIGKRLNDPIFSRVMKTPGRCTEPCEVALNSGSSRLVFSGNMQGMRLCCCPALWFSFKNPKRNELPVGSKAKYTPSEDPNPTNTIGSKMGGAPTPKWYPIGFDPQPHLGQVHFEMAELHFDTQPLFTSRIVTTEDFDHGSQPLRPSRKGFVFGAGG